MGSLALMVCLGAAVAPEPPTIRVLVVEGAESVTIRTDGAVAFLRPGDRRPLWQGRNLPDTEIAPAGNGLRVGESEVPVERLRFAAQGLWHVGDREYAGTLEVIRDGDHLRVVNEVDFENYVMGVVGPEIGARSPMEALKAQAVAARTYAWCRKRDRAGENRDYDVFDDTRDQVYRGHPGRGSNVERAVRETAGQMLTWNGQPFTTYFHSTCGGRTQSVAEWSPGATEIPPLAGAECGACDETTYSTWTFEVGADDLGDWATGPVQSIDVTETAPRSGYPLRVRIVAGATTTVTASQFRSRVGTERVRSPYFTVRREADRFVVEGHGWGHGVGMCQMGAIGLGRRNTPYAQILERYYPRSRLAPFWRWAPGR